jgi:hypothetical protein
MVLLTKRADPSALAAAMRANSFPPLKRARRDPHDPGPSCWLHADSCCLSL